MAQEQAPNLTECNRCKAAKFPGVMISFQRTNKTKPNGQPIWLLLNPDGSGHTHLAEQSTRHQQTYQQPTAQEPLEAKPPMQDTFITQMAAQTQAIKGQTEALKQLTLAVNLLVASVNNRAK